MFQNQDWPNLNRYKVENSLVKAPSKEENRVVFMGDSITEYWSKLDPEFFAGKPFLNRGISAQTTPQMLIRFRQDVIALKPTIVVILAGTNDIAGNTGPSTPEMIMDNINSMADLAQVNKIKAILCSILPAHQFSWNLNIKPAEIIVDLNQRIRKFADERGMIFADFHSPMADELQGLKKEYGNDGVHPNKAGYEVMDKVLEKSIMIALNEK